MEKDQNQNIKESEVKKENANELFEEVEEVVTAAWTGCADCCG